MRAAFGASKGLLPPILLGVFSLAIWQAAVVWFNIKPFIVPSPLSIGAQFSENFATVWSNSMVTGLNSLLGLLLGLVIGVCLALIAAMVRAIDELSAAVVAAAMVIPIVALAPVLYGMFSAAEQTARILVAALAVFVPVYVNTLKGLRQVKPVHRDLMRALAAGTWETTRIVTLPTALPFLFTGLRIASSLAVIAAVIAEYFGGPIGGLGKAITTAASQSNYPLAWAYVLGSIILGLLFYLASMGLEKLVLKGNSSR
ncbi:ABC transporter permease [Homoserinimonas sp. OAct 916]|uniref:ABC transporter permease n=1 Tax=Homoserinimonas sp. OAct 916 TaxID=2211450 RepID=UPI000DBE7F8E|nr:ABC transporter permease subunit [Homoserinimonas sp. OAct 916]